MITISFYSYKGGVGRSLALTNLAVYLAQFGASVVMIDFDLEAPGLHYKLRPGEPLVPNGRGLAGLLADVSAGVSLDALDWDVAMDVSEHATPPELQGAVIGQEPGNLVLIPAGNPMVPEYWQDLGTIDWDKLFTRGDRPGIAVMARLKDEVVTRYSPDVLLVDSRTGITPGGGVATTLLPDVVVTLLLNTPEHLDGSRMVVSAVVGSGYDGSPGPSVVPVLSRYASAPPRRMPPAARRRALAMTGVDTEPDEVPLDAVRQHLLAGLAEEAAERIGQTLVLHSDPDLQYIEQLAFGPYAGRGVAGPGSALLEDYIKLFATLVPRDTFMRHLDGVRSHVRGILLDQPDDAVRTLESLATLVGDEAAFIDLVKLYVLRRDSRNLIRAAERLFRVHERVVQHPALSHELRSLALEHRPVTPADPMPVAPFMEAYWRSAAPEDVVWGAAVARRFADGRQVSRARDLADELAGRADDPAALAAVVRGLAAGTPLAEQLAVQFAVKYFERGAGSLDFLDAAAQACSYQPDEGLAERIFHSPHVRSLSEERLVSVLDASGRHQEAEELLLSSLSHIELFDPVEDWQVRYWTAFQRRNPGLRAELAQRNPDALDVLESAEAEG